MQSWLFVFLNRYSAESIDYLVMKIQTRREKHELAKERENMKSFRKKRIDEENKRNERTQSTIRMPLLLPLAFAVVRFFVLWLPCRDLSVFVREFRSVWLKVSFLFFYFCLICPSALVLSSLLLSCKNSFGSVDLFASFSLHLTFYEKDSKFLAISKNWCPTSFCWAQNSNFPPLIITSILLHFGFYSLQYVCLSHVLDFLEHETVFLFCFLFFSLFFFGNWSEETLKSETSRALRTRANQAMSRLLSRKGIDASFINSSTKRPAARLF